jgi:hypothetical protein
MCVYLEAMSLFDIFQPMEKARILNSRRNELLFLAFPFWIPLVYLALIQLFPNNHVVVFTLFVLILGETHFAATWLFFSLPSNRSWVKSNFNKIVIWPSILLTFYFIFSLFSPSKGALLGSLFSAIHVTRQSIGVVRLYRAPRNGIHEILIYLFSATFLLIGAIRFFIPEYFSDIFSILANITSYNSSGFICHDIPFIRAAQKPDELESRDNYRNVDVRSVSLCIKSYGCSCYGRRNALVPVSSPHL